MEEKGLDREQIKIVSLIWFIQTSCAALFFALPAVLPFIKQEFILSQRQVGLLVSALNLGNVLFLMPSGYVIDSLGEKRILAGGLSAMAVLGVLTFGVHSFGILLLCFLGIGIAFSTTAPGTNKAVMNWVPVSWRATIMGLKQMGATVGGVLAAMAVPLIPFWGWRSLYGAIAVWIAISVWLLIKIYYEPDSRDQSGNTISGYRKRLGEVFANRRLILLAVAGFLLGGAQYSILAYTFLYLKEALQVPVVAAGMAVGWIQFTAAAARLGGGVVSDRFLGHRRKPVLMIFAAVSLISLFAGSHLEAGMNTWLVFSLFGIIGFFGLGYNGIYLTLAMELSEKRAAGLATSVAVTALFAGGALFLP
jgi:sugar phosphate permease